MHTSSTPPSVCLLSLHPQATTLMEEFHCWLLLNFQQNRMVPKEVSGNYMLLEGPTRIDQIDKGFNYCHLQIVEKN